MSNVPNAIVKFQPLDNITYPLAHTGKMPETMLSVGTFGNIKQKNKGGLNIGFDGICFVGLTAEQAKALADTINSFFK